MIKSPFICIFLTPCYSAYGVTRLDVVVTNFLNLVAVAFVVSALTVATAVSNQGKPSTDHHIIIAEGKGATEKEALKAAFRDAVSRVSSMQETLVRNDEVIKDRILEYRGGFVKT